MESEELVTVEPNELLFETNKGAKLRSAMKLTNTSKRRVAFRVQTNNPGVYLVRPNCGFLDPTHMTDISIELLDRQMFRPKDRFLVSAAPCVDDEADRVQFWHSVPVPVHQRIKVGVRMSPSSTDSPKCDSKADAHKRSTDKATTMTGVSAVGTKETPRNMQIAGLCKENERLRHRVGHSGAREVEHCGGELKAGDRMLWLQLDAADGYMRTPVNRRRHGALLGLFLAVALLIGIWLINYLSA